MAREKNGLVFLNKKIQVYADIPNEALTIRKNLKPIISSLQEAKIGYRWHATGKMMILIKNKPHFAWDLNSGGKLLQLLNTEDPMEQEPRSNKRKLQFTSSPVKSSKIPVRNTT